MNDVAGGSWVRRSPLARWRRLAAPWLVRSLDLVYPPECPCCQAPLEPGDGQALCAACRKALVVARPACRRCGSIVPAQQAADSCPRCQSVRYRFASVTRLGAYDGLLRQSVLRVKRPHERGLAIALAELLADERLAELKQLELDAALPVPMHWTRRMRRGANSPETIAERLAVHVNLPLAGQLLSRRRRTVPQTDLSPHERRANVRGAFRAHAHRDLPGAKLLLVDDIMTTGATVNEIARVLRQAGAASVHVAVLARAALDS